MEQIKLEVLRVGYVARWENFCKKMRSYNLVMHMKHHEQMDSIDALTEKLEYNFTFDVNALEKEIMNEYRIGEKN